MRDTTSVRLTARNVRDKLLSHGGPDESDFRRVSYRPFDNRWLYWQAEPSLARPRPEYRPHTFTGNLWLCAAQHLRKGRAEPQANFTKHVGQLHLIERSASLFPAWLCDESAGTTARAPNLSGAAIRYLEHVGLDIEDLFHHVLAVLHDPSYQHANADALRMGWPRIPVPGWPDSAHPEAAEDLAASAARGRDLACLLDPETPVAGVTEGVPRRS